MSFASVTKWRSLKRWLRKHFPASRRVRVVVVDLPREGPDALDGYVEDGKDGELLVRIASRQSPCGQRATLLHEWAHVVTWDCAAEEDHPPEWGIAYGRLIDSYFRQWPGSEE